MSAHQPTLRERMAEYRKALGRIRLTRIAVPNPRRAHATSPTTESEPWSHGLWGQFLPDRRQGGRLPSDQPERRRR